jgi:manganese transport protein
MLLLALRRGGAGRLEALIVSLLAVIATCFALQMWWLHPSLAAIARGFSPAPAILHDPYMLYVAVGILGATVMPHNLYLHSSLVRGASPDRDEHSVRRAICYATTDSSVALGLALFVNFAILIVAGAAFHDRMHTSVTQLGDAYRLLSPVVGVGAASGVFGAALIASGLSSSITGTLAGQVVMEGFLQIRISRTTRALLTRSLAILPAVGAAMWAGDAGVGKLLIFSQVILGLQLPFAVVPLLLFTTRHRYLGQFAFKSRTAFLLWGIAAAVILLNVWLIWTVLGASSPLP